MQHYWTTSDACMITTCTLYTVYYEYHMGCVWNAGVQPNTGTVNFAHVNTVVFGSGNICGLFGRLECLSATYPP